MVFVSTSSYLSIFLIICCVYCKRPRRDEPDYSKLEFGGILHKKVDGVSLQDKDVAAVIQFSYNSAKKRFPWTVPDLINSTKASDIQKLELVFSIDEEKPVYKEDLIGGDRQDSYPLHIIVFGFLYKFTMDCVVQKGNYVHQFVVSMFPRDVLNLYSHTFVEAPLQTPGLPLSVPCRDDSQLSSISQSEALLQKGQSEHFHKDTHHWLNDAGRQSFDVESCTASTTTTEFPPKPEFSIMSFNTWNMNSLSQKDKHYVKRIEHLGKVLADSQPDIVGFQEVRYEYSKGGQLGPSQVQHLADMLDGYQFVFQPGQLQPNSLYEGRTEEGVAIFSRYPIISTNHILLFRNQSNSADTHQRVCLHAVISHPSGVKINVLNTHLSLSHEAREKSVIEIWKYTEHLQGPVIVMGDMNAEPDEKAMRFLRGDVSLEKLRTRGLVDVWMKKHEEYPGFTYNVLDDVPSKRIDYIYMKTSDDFQLLDVSTPDDKQRGDKAASDHLPVFATFTLTTPHT